MIKCDKCGREWDEKLYGDDCLFCEDIENDVRLDRLAEKEEE